MDTVSHLTEDTFTETVEQPGRHRDRLRGRLVRPMSGDGPPI